MFVNLFEQCLILLCEQLFNDMPMHIGEASFDTVVIVCQPGVIERIGGYSLVLTLLDHLRASADRGDIQRNALIVNRQV